MEGNVKSDGDAAASGTVQAVEKDAGAAAEGKSDGAREKSISARGLSTTYLKVEVRGKLLKNSVYCFLCAVFGVVLMIVQFEATWFENTVGFFPVCDHNEPPDMCDPGRIFPVNNTVNLGLANGVRTLITVSTLVLVALVYRQYVLHTQMLVLKFETPPTKHFFEIESLKRSFMIEVAVCLLHPFPFVDSVFGGRPFATLALSLVMFVRIYLAVWVIIYRSSCDETEVFVQSMTIGTTESVKFTAFGMSHILKKNLSIHAKQCMIAFTASLFIFFGYSLHTIESYTCLYYNTVNNDVCYPPDGLLVEHFELCCPQNFLSFTDSLWMLVLATTTIGYGDITPHTHAGRFVIVLGSVGGLLIVALVFTFSVQMMRLTENEGIVVDFVQKIDVKNNITFSAVLMIQRGWRFRLAYQKSCIWYRNKFGIAYRPLANRIPFEHALDEAISEWRAARKAKNTSEIDAKPMSKLKMALDTATIKLEDLDEMVDEMNGPQAEDNEGTLAISTTAEGDFGGPPIRASNSSTPVNTSAQGEGSHFLDPKVLDSALVSKLEDKFDDAAASAFDRVETFAQTNVSGQQDEVMALRWLEESKKSLEKLSVMRGQMQSIED